MKNLQTVKPAKDVRERKKPDRFGYSILCVETDTYPCIGPLITYEGALNDRGNAYKAVQVELTSIASNVA